MERSNTKVEGLREQRETQQPDSDMRPDSARPQPEVEEAAGGALPKTDEQMAELYYEGRDIIQALYAHMDHMGG